MFSLVGSLGELYLPQCDATSENPWSIADVLPQISGIASRDFTEWRSQAAQVWVHPDLRLTRQLESDGTLEEVLHQYLARTISSEPGPTHEWRNVEPGVGRTVLVDNLKLENAPEYRDFSCSGVGLTLFARRGYVDVGRHLDGKVSLMRALHRKETAERLEKIGCRAAKVVAIYELPDEPVRMLDGTSSPAVIMVRAFRNILRIKQLDPIAPFLHGDESHAIVASAIIEQCASAIQPDLNQLLTIFDTHRKLGPKADDLPHLLGLTENWHELIEDSPVRDLRLMILRSYAGPVLRLAARRQGFPCSIQSSSSGIAEYLAWFSREMGRQLGSFRRHRFLHDYHHPGITRFTENWLYTLVENNVTLSAEFADLETAAFVDTDTPYLCEALQLKPRDVELLRVNFEQFHRTDLLQGYRSVETVLKLAELIGATSSNVTKSGLVEFTQAYLDASSGSSENERLTT